MLTAFYCLAYWRAFHRRLFPIFPGRSPGGASYLLKLKFNILFPRLIIRAAALFNGAIRDGISTCLLNKHVADDYYYKSSNQETGSYGHRSRHCGMPPLFEGNFHATTLEY